MDRKGRMIIFAENSTMMKELETSWKSGDGLRIHARIWEPEGGDCCGVVVLVHGIGEHTGRYFHVAEAFTGKGLVFFAPDMRGHGLSEGKRGHLPAEETILSDIDGYMENARERYSGLPVFLYGHSLGGILVLYYGLMRREGLTGVICTSPGLRNALQEQPAKVMAARVLGTLFPGVTISSGLDSSAISRDPEVVARYRMDSLVHDRMSLGFGKVMLGVIAHTLGHIGEFPHPLLVMHGTADTIAYMAGSEQVAGALGGKCTWVPWAGFYHELHNEPAKKEVLEVMTGWVNDKLHPQG